MPDTLTLDDLNLISGTTFGLTERQWQKVQFAFWDITGKHRATAHYITDACLDETYDEIAGDLITAESSPSLIEDILQMILFLCKMHYGSAVDLSECRAKMRDRLRHWSGKLGRIKIEAEEEAERLSAATPTPKLDGPLESDTGNIPTATRKRVDRFIDRVLIESGTPITRKDFWRVAGYREATQFERYQRDKNPSAGSVAKFSKILALPTSLFLDRLKKINEK